MKKVSRAEKAGRMMGRALVEWVHMMYQDNTALNLFRGLTDVLNKEVQRRQKQAEAKKR